MAPTSRVVRDEVDNLLSYLVDSEIALDTTPVRAERGRVSWLSYANGAEFLEHRDPPTLAAYRAWLSAGAYSALLYDGALLQVTYDFVGHMLVAHRLAWVPCPFDLDAEFLQTDPLDEVLDVYESGNTADVVLRTAIRFDYDLERSAEDHPAAHMSLNSARCRVRLRRASSIGPLRGLRLPEFLSRYVAGTSISRWGVAHRMGFPYGDARSGRKAPHLLATIDLRQSRLATAMRRDVSRRTSDPARNAPPALSVCTQPRCSLLLSPNTKRPHHHTPTGASRAAPRPPTPPAPRSAAAASSPARPSLPTR